MNLPDPYWGLLNYPKNADLWNEVKLSKFLNDSGRYRASQKFQQAPEHKAIEKGLEVDTIHGGQVSTSLFYTDNFANQPLTARNDDIKPDNTIDRDLHYSGDGLEITSNAYGPIPQARLVKTGSTPINILPKDQKHEPFRFKALHNSYSPLIPPKALLRCEEKFYFNEINKSLRNTVFVGPKIVAREGNRVHTYANAVADLYNYFKGAHNDPANLMSKSSLSSYFFWLNIFENNMETIDPKTSPSMYSLYIKPYEPWPADASSNLVDAMYNGIATSLTKGVSRTNIYITLLLLPDLHATHPRSDVVKALQQVLCKWMRAGEPKETLPLIPKTMPNTEPSKQAPKSKQPPHHYVQYNDTYARQAPYLPESKPEPENPKPFQGLGANQSLAKDEKPATNLFGDFMDEDEEKFYDVKDITWKNEKEMFENGSIEEKLDVVSDILKNKTEPKDEQDEPSKGLKIMAPFTFMQNTISKYLGYGETKNNAIDLTLDEEKKEKEQLKDDLNQVLVVTTGKSGEKGLQQYLSNVIQESDMHVVDNKEKFIISVNAAMNDTKKIVQNHIENIHLKVADNVPKKLEYAGAYKKIDKVRKTRRRLQKTKKSIGSLNEQGMDVDYLEEKKEYAELSKDFENRRIEFVVNGNEQLLKLSQTTRAAEEQAKQVLNAISKGHVDKDFMDYLTSNNWTVSELVKEQNKISNAIGVDDTGLLTVMAASADVAKKVQDIEYEEKEMRMDLTEDKEEFDEDKEELEEDKVIDLTELSTSPPPSSPPPLEYAAAKSSWSVNAIFKKAINAIVSSNKHPAEALKEKTVETVKEKIEPLISPVYEDYRLQLEQLASEEDTAMLSSPIAEIRYIMWDYDSNEYVDIGNIEAEQMLEKGGINIFTIDEETGAVLIKFNDIMDHEGFTSTVADELLFNKMNVMGTALSDYLDDFLKTYTKSSEGPTGDATLHMCHSFITHIVPKIAAHYYSVLDIYDETLGSNNESLSFKNRLAFLVEIFGTIKMQSRFMNGHTYLEDDNYLKSIYAVAAMEVSGPIFTATIEELREVIRWTTLESLAIMHDINGALNGIKTVIQFPREWSQQPTYYRSQRASRTKEQYKNIYREKKDYKLLRAHRYTSAQQTCLHGRISTPDQYSNFFLNDKRKPWLLNLERVGRPDIKFISFLDPTSMETLVNAQHNYYESLNK